MTCGACGARRRRLQEAAKAALHQPSLTAAARVAAEAAKGVAELTGISPKTALDEDAKERNNGE